MSIAISAADEVLTTELFAPAIRVDLVQLPSF